MYLNRTIKIKQREYFLIIKDMLDIFCYWIWKEKKGNWIWIISFSQENMLKICYQKVGLEFI